MKRLLIVDDIPQNLYMLEVLLKTNGYEVETAVNGTEALIKAREKSPDMIITDILMPGMDGFSLCRIWKTDDDLKNIPLIFYTATYTDEKDKVFAFGLGADRFVVKPMEPVELLAIIEDVFENKSNDEISISENANEEDKYIREYNEVLIRKLEDKMMQLQQSNKRLFTLFHTSNILGVIKPIKESIHEVLITLVEKAGYQMAFYYFFDENKNVLYLQDAISQPKESIEFSKNGMTFDYGQENGLVGLVAETGKLINIPDINTDPRWIDFGDNVGSALYIPVHYEHHLLGVMALYNAEKDAFTEVDEHILTTLSNNLAISIENRSSQDKVQNQFQRLSSLHKIDKAIINSTDLSITLNLLITHVISQLGVDAADILLYNWQTQSYKFAAVQGFQSKVLRYTNIEQVLAKKAIHERRIIHLESEKELPEAYPFKKEWDNEGFNQYWGLPIIAKGIVKGVLEVYQRSENIVNLEWIDFLESLAGQAAIAIENAEIQEGLIRSNYELTLAYDATIEGWSHAMDLRDKETEGHTLRVTNLAIQLARMAGMSEEEIVHVRRGALLHDMGKLGIPDSILLKPGPLDEDEWELMRKHPLFGYEMLSPIYYLKPALDIPYCHHEKMDGSGYPRGLKGEEIPLAARVFAVVDVYDALTSDRPYRLAWSKEKALEYIQSGSGSHFDPKVVNQFIELIQIDPEWLPS